MRRRSNAAALGCLILLGMSSTACANTGGTATAATWESSAAFGVLGSIAATADSRFSVSLVDVTVLNLVDRAAEQPLSTTAEAPSDRPPAESAWSRYALSAASCTGLVESAPFSSSSPVRTGPLEETVNVGFGDFDAPALLSVCQGPIDPAQLSSVLEDGWTPQTVAGVPGMATEQFWVGYQAGGPRTTMIGDDVPAATADAVLTGTSVPDSLAADPGVRAVVAAAPRAATIEMGTFLLGFGSVATADDEVLAAIGAAQEKVGGTLPAPTFAGFGWTPGVGLDGTATFVTTYGSEAEAGSAAAVLADTWPRLHTSDGPLAAATTSATGTVVVTEVADVPPDEFDLRTLRLADYPGWGAG